MSGRKPTARDARVIQVDAIARQLRELEELLLRPDVRTSPEVAELIADDFVEFGSSGRVYAKTDMIAALLTESPVALSASEFHVAMLADDVALVTYRATRHATTPVHSLRSSIWRLREGRWRIVFHQGTLTAPLPNGPP